MSATVPDGWVVHESPELGYVMAHPPEWEASLEPATGEIVYSGPDGEEIRVASYVYEEGWAADMLLLGAVADAHDRFGTDPAFVNEFTRPEGTRVNVYAADYRDGRGEFFFQRAVVLSQPVVWYVDWYSEPGDEGGDRQQFLPFVQSFVPAPDLDAEQGA